MNCRIFFALSIASFSFGSDADAPKQPKLDEPSPLAVALAQEIPTFKTVAIRLMQDSSGNISIVPDTGSYRLFLEQVQETFPQAEVIIAGGRDLEQGNNFAWWKKQDPLPTCSIILQLDNGKSRKRAYLRQPTQTKFTDKPTRNRPSRPLISTTEMCVFAAVTTAAIAFSYFGTRYLKQRSKT